MIRIVTGLALAAALGGCVSFGAKPPPSLLNLTAQVSAPANAGRSVAAGEAIAVLTPSVPQAFSVNRVAVMSGATNIAYVKDAVWVEPPAKLLQHLLSETISAKTGRVVLDQRQFSVAPGLQLSGAINVFAIDANSGQAVFVFDAVLTGDQGKTVRTRRFEARTAVGEIDAANSGRALNQAANAVAADVADWIAG